MIPPGWDYSIDVLADLLREARERGVPIAVILDEAERRDGRALDQEDAL